MIIELKWQDKNTQIIIDIVCTDNINIKSKLVIII